MHTRSPRTYAPVIIAAAVALIVVGVIIAFALRDDATTAQPPGQTLPPVSLAPSGGASASPGGPVVVTQTRFGASFQTRDGEGYDAALQRVDAAMGGMKVVRVFYKEAPDPWPGKAPDRDVVVSFKLLPAEVLAGTHDARMREWFAAAPKDHTVNWVYWHEPENDIKEEKFTADEFRRAFAHLDRLADEARNPRLRSTLVLQSFTTRERSGRNWQDYYPGDSVIDIFGWDVYNRPKQQDEPYASPQTLIGPLRDIAKSRGKPFAIAEIGSEIAAGDDGTERAKWLRAVGDYCKSNGADFVAYFDFVWAGNAGGDGGNRGKSDYRLRDAASAQAWRDLVSGR